MGYLSEAEAKKDVLFLRYAFESGRTGREDRTDEWIPIRQRDEMSEQRLSTSLWLLFRDARAFARQVSSSSTASSKAITFANECLFVKATR